MAPEQHLTGAAGNLQLFLDVSDEDNYYNSLKPRIGYAIPVDDIRHVIGCFPVGHQIRMITIWRALTGCRISEINNMSLTGLKGNYFYWKTGKNQSGWRHAYIPEYAIKEYKRYRDLNPVVNTKLFNICARTYRRQFNNYRRLFGLKWCAKTYAPEKQSTCIATPMEYTLQIKGIRHTYATLLFYKMLHKYNDSHVAVLMTAKEMCHSSERMTSRHYIENGDIIHAAKYIHLEIWDLFNVDWQKTLV